MAFPNRMIAYRVRVLHVTVAYVASFLVLAGARTAIVGGPLLAEIAPISGPMYQPFIFFMITHPRTTVRSRRGRVLVAVAMWWDLRRKARAERAVPATAGAAGT